MSYYTLSPAVNTADTGPVFPQIQKMSAGYNYNEEHSVYKLAQHISEFPDFSPNLDYFVVQPKAIVTDVLSTSLLSPSGFLISERLKKIVSAFNLIPHKFYPARVFHKNTFFIYHWMHFKPNLLPTVDFQRSSFIALLNYAHVIGHVHVLSLKDYFQKKEKIKKDNPGKTISLWADKIFLSQKFDNELDFFKFGTFDTDFYISDHAKNTFESNNITGVQINMTNKITI